MHKLPDVTVVGGGIIGLLTARACVLAGAQVRVIEKGQIGQESSWAGGGILMPLYPWRQPAAISQLVLHSIHLYPELIASLAINSEIDPGFLTSGLFITQNPDISAALDWCHQSGIKVSEAPASLTQSLAAPLLNPLWLPEIRQVRNPRLLQAVAADLSKRGVEFITDCELYNVAIEQHQVRHLQTSQGNLPTQKIVLTTGAWTGDLWSQLFTHHPAPSPAIAPVKGQMLLFDAPPELLTAIVLDQDHYLIPRLDGKILAGSTVEYAGYDKNVDKQVLSNLSDFAYRLLPALRACPIIKHWAGLRPGTQYGIPYIDQHPDLSNVFINAGHFRNGLAMAPASAQLVTDLMYQRPTQVNARPYQLQRES